MPDESNHDTMQNTSHPHTPLARDQYWPRTRRWTGMLLGIWFLATFVIIFFARELSTVSFFGWPLSFYLAAQGAVVIYLLIVAAYALVMDHEDRKAHDE